MSTLSSLESRDDHSGLAVSSGDDDHPDRADRAGDVADMSEPTADLNKTNVELINFRLDQLQLSAQSVNAQLASLSTQVMGVQNIMSEKFLTRLEFAEVLRQKEIQQTVIDKRLDSMNSRDDDQDKALYDIQSAEGARGWMLAGTLAMAIFALIGTAFVLVATLHH